MTYLTLDAHKHGSTHSGATFSTPAFSVPHPQRNDAFKVWWDLSQTLFATFLENVTAKE